MYKHITDSIERPFWVDLDPPEANLYESLISSGTDRTLTDTTANWEVNEWVDKIVRVYRDGGDFEYAVVESNTSDTLTFDDDLIFIPCPTCNYDIIHTYVVPSNMLPHVIAINMNLFSWGILLPKSTVGIERLYINPYIERKLTESDSVTAPIMSRTTDRQLGAKYGELIFRGESVVLYPHTYLSNHFDVISAFNIRRLAAGYYELDNPITTIDYGRVALEANITFDERRRFIEVIRDGQKYLRYTSLFQRPFKFAFTANIEKTGTGGEASIAVMKRDGVTGVETVLDTRKASTIFGGGEGIQTITVEVPVTLNRNDELIPVAKRTSGTFAVGEGSYISVKES